MNPEAFRQLLNQIPDAHRPWFLNGLITGLAITVSPETQEYLINPLALPARASEVINPTLSADEATALEAVSLVLTEAPPIGPR
jgi:hypothetical protein